MGHIGGNPTGPAPADAHFRRLVTRASEKYGFDCCHICKRPFTSLEPMIIGRVRRAGVRVVGECCGDRLHSIIGAGIYIAMPDWMRAIPSGGGDLRAAGCALVCR
jgi:hypothetical protein